MKKSLFGLALALAGVLGILPAETQAGGIPACSEATPDLSQDSLLISGNFKNCKKPSAWLGQANGSYTKLVATVVNKDTVQVTLINTAVVVGSTQNVVVKCDKSARCAIDVAFVEECEDCEEGPPAPVAKTGQTTKYADGDDGALQKGVTWPTPRFTINVNADKDTGAGGGMAGDAICNGTEECNGTVTDNLTGLIWLRNANCFGSQYWTTALNDANTLNSGECGLTDGSAEGDWRLPNIKELQSLIHFGYLNPALSNTDGTGQWVEGEPFSGVMATDYWSSTSVAVSTDIAWFLGLGDGLGSKGDKGYSFYVWPVRGGQ